MLMSFEQGCDFGAKSGIVSTLTFEVGIARGAGGDLESTMEDGFETPELLLPIGELVLHSRHHRTGSAPARAERRFTVESEAPYLC